MSVKSIKKIENTIFLSGLKKLDMISGKTDSIGLVFVEEDNKYSSLTYFALEKAIEYEADAVYFRSFNNGKPPVPQIYVYDYTTKDFDDDKQKELHKKLWNSGLVPLFFVFTKTEVKIFNCLETLINEKDEFVSKPLESIKWAADIEKGLKEFSAKKFDNGSFWETSKYKNRFKQSDSAYEKLLAELKSARRNIINKEILPKVVADKLLVTSILVKYLEERVDKNNNTVFPPDFFKEFVQGAENFTDILRERGACLRLFDYLSSHFNGGIFKWEENKQRDLLNNTDLSTYADFLEGKIDGMQKTLWSLYSFNDLPIELISNIYEEFIGDKQDKKDTGAVYTPPELVNFMIDEVMSIEKPEEDFKVIDPSCGSGVFLVGAYKRLINWWRIKNNWKKPDLKTLKNILKKNIYGVDIKGESVQLAIFSLSLALCDELAPKVIWEELKFDDLSRDNLLADDFFNLIEEKKFENFFDLVIGNPPFISKLNSTSAKEIEKREEKNRKKLPDTQIALLFLEQSIKMVKKNGFQALIMPAGPFLYNENSFDFRNKLLEKNRLLQVLDFTPLAETLFGSASVATAAVFFKKEKQNEKNILHVTVRRTKASKEKLFFDVDHYDFHKVTYKEAVENRYVWKSNLLGGGRVKHLIKRLSSYRTFGEYLAEKIKNHGWVVGEGFIINGGGKKKKADYLTGKPTLPTDAFSEKGIDNNKIHLLEEEFFYRSAKQNREIFLSPHVLIKELAGKNSIPVEYREDDLSFKDQIIGIHAPLHQKEELQRIARRIKDNRILLFHLAVSSAKYLIKKATVIAKCDIESLPCPINLKDIELSEIDQIVVDDVLKYIIDFRKKGENSNAVKPATESILKEFGNIYCEVLNSVYNDFKPASPVKTDSFICFPFYYKEKPELLENDNNLENHLKTLSEKKIGTNLRITRVLRLYENNVVYLIKPNQIRYWMKSTAVRDADETFDDLVKQGY